MDYAQMGKDFWDRKGLINIGAVEVPGGHWGALRWDDIPKDCLPLFLYKTSAPKCIIAANRMQLDTLRTTDKDVVREMYILEIERIRKHSNIDYCAGMVEMDRKYKKKKKRILASEQRTMIRDVIENLNRTKTAEEIAALYGTTKINITMLAVKLRKAPYHFKIPTVRGYSEFDIVTAQIAKERPDLVAQPLATKHVIVEAEEILKRRGGGRPVGTGASARNGN